MLWEASDRICGKRLKVLLPVLLESMERHGHIQLEKEVREQVLTLSAATIDRRLRPVRQKAVAGAEKRPATTIACASWCRCARLQTGERWDRATWRWIWSCTAALGRRAALPIRWC